MIKNNKAFTLLELALSLIIVTLLISSLIGARALQRSAKLQGVIKQTNEIIVAIDNFQARFDALPGDFNKANMVFSNMSEGDNNGVIESDEYFYSWLHLELANLLAGSFSGAGTFAIPDTNVPSSRYIEGAGYNIAYITAGSLGYADTAGNDYSGNYLLFGRRANIEGNTNLKAGVLNSADSLYIDSKLDNQRADFGDVLTVNSESGNDCITSDAYDLSKTSEHCIIYFKINNK